MMIKEIVKQFRKELGETQTQFGDRFGVTANTVSRWESGIYQVPNAVIEKIAQPLFTYEICDKCHGQGRAISIIWN